MHDLAATLRRLHDRLTRSGAKSRMGEQDTKAVLIEPVLDALDWDTRDPDVVTREYRRKGRDNPVDYALLLMRTPRLFVEAKGLGENLDDPRWANQAISYAAVAGVEWVALTDGDTWRLYNAPAPVPTEQKMFREVRVSVDPAAAADTLRLLGREEMSGDRISELWRSFFVDRQVGAALEGMFNTTDPAIDVVNLVMKRITGLQRADVKASLARARASFDFPAVASPGPMPPLRSPQRPTPTPPRVAGSGTKPSRRPKVSPAEKHTTLVDLLASGHVEAGQELHVRYRGETRRATVLPDGTVQFNGTTYASLSRAGEAAKESISGPDIPATVRATDGWGFWSVTLKGGEAVALKELRRRAVETGS